MTRLVCVILCPLIIIFDDLLQGYGRAGCLAEAKAQLLTMLADARVCPDTIALNSFLDAAVRNNELPLAMATLARVSQQVSVYVEILFCDTVE